MTNNLWERIDNEMKTSLNRLVDNKNWNIYQGEFVNRLETLLGEMLGGYCLLTNAGTTALELALRSTGCNGEIIIPSTTFVATAQAVFMTGGKPLIAMVDPESYNLTSDHLSKTITPRTRGIIGVHLFGNPSHVKELSSYCQRKGLIFIEDCAQAFGASENGQPVGTFDRAGAFSFNLCKHITSGEGGAVVTKHRDVYLTAKAIRHAGLRPTSKGEYHAFEIGGKYLMTELQAAVLLPQAQHWPEILAQRLRQAELAKKFFSSVEHCRLQVHTDSSVHTFQRVAGLADTPGRVDSLIRQYPFLERFYPLPLTEEPVIKEKAIFTGETREFTRDFWERNFGITLKPFNDITELLQSYLREEQ